MENRVQKTVRDAINGDYDNVDPALRRGLMFAASEVDALESRVSDELQVLNGHVKDLKRLLMGTTTSLILVLVTATLNLLY